ncbi:unnamed protein product [Phytophthora fragariaefolia]|uniref:Unnamed protein product n=1 Tax=Phytophthora fragariaefolia TaxID=1490495 RepID=A0A9W7D9B5_9STRA|nr:unnamed protein product [Phytophthora fragariaefolia]
MTYFATTWDNFIRNLGMLGNTDQYFAPTGCSPHSRTPHFMTGFTKCKSGDNIRDDTASSDIQREIYAPLEDISALQQQFVDNVLLKYIT